MIPVFNSHLHQQPVHVHELDVRTGDGRPVLAIDGVLYVVNEVRS